MSQLELQREIEALKKLVSALEKKVAERLSNSMFGRSYSQIGSSDSDFIIKTKGLVKIQWGNKFIDLIKDGKINVNSKFIFTVDSVKNIGAKDGIYVTKDEAVYLKTGDSIVNLIGEIGNSYVSFMGLLNTTSELKLTALKNIGFIYNDISEVDSSAVLNGIIYLLSEQKLYVISDGTISEFSLEIPNPFTQLFIILKKDSSLGALIIKGSGINNSLVFDSLYIYNDEGNSRFLSEGNIEFAIDNETILEITRDNATVKVNLVCNMLKSVGADNESGFRLYTDSSGSTLEVDRVIARDPSFATSTVIFPNYWSLENNVVAKVIQILEASQGSGYALTLKYENLYEVGDRLYIYGEVNVDNFRKKLLKIPVEVTMVNTLVSNTIYVLIISGVDSEVDNLEELPNIVGQVTFLVSTNKQITLLRYLEYNLDLLLYTLFEEESKKDSVKSRVGDLTSLLLKGRENGGEVSIEGLGTYSQNAAFLKALYVSLYSLAEIDNSSKFASTEWVNKLIPKGAIIMFNGSASEIPKGWAICDGTNGTPNLVGKFIKAGTSSGLTGGASEVTLTVDNLPAHTHSIEGTARTSTDGSHKHSISYSSYSLADGSNTRNVVLGDLTAYTSSDGDHSHTLDVSSVTIGLTGKGTPLKIEPSYYSLIYIMKVI